jgi:hypothetical protein
VLIAPEQWEVIVRRAKGELLDILQFLRETGSRSQEVRVVEAQHVRGDHILLPKVG